MQSFSSSHWLSFYNGKTAVTISRTAKGPISITSPKGNLVLLRHLKYPVFLFTKVIKGKTYEVALKTDLSMRTIKKVGLISYAPTVRYSEDCGPEKDLDKITSQLQKISNFLSKDDIENLDISAAVDTSCSNVMDLTENLVNNFNPKESYLLSCLKSREANNKIAAIPSLLAAIPRVLDVYLLELEALKNGQTPSFQISCEETEEKGNRFHAKYNENTKAITFPIKNRNLSTDACNTENSLFTHEYAHHAGIKSETDLSNLDSLCREVAGIQKCKNDVQDSDNTSTLDSKAAASEALSQAITEVAGDDRRKLGPELQAAVAELSVEPVAIPGEVMNTPNLSAAEPSSTTVAASQPASAMAAESTSPAAASTSAHTSNIASGQTASSGNGGNTRPAGTTSVATTADTAYSPAVQRMAGAMTKNLNSISKAFDTALGATVNTASAASSNSTATATTSSKRRPAGSLRSAATKRTTTNKAKPEEYLVEEIIADKHGLPVNTVKLAAAEIRNKNTARTKKARAEKPESSVPDSPAAAGETASSQVSSAFSGPSGSRSASKASPRKPAARNMASIPRSSGSTGDPISSASPLLNRQEVMGQEYRNLKQQYNDPKFIESLKRDNIQIVIVRGRKRIGSEDPKAVFVDNGRSVLKRK